MSNNIKITDQATTYVDYSDLISEQDFDKYFKDKAFIYNDILLFAVLRKLDDLNDSICGWR